MGNLGTATRFQAYHHAYSYDMIKGDMQVQSPGEAIELQKACIEFGRKNETPRSLKV